jgi:hypothetical protein
MKARQQATGKTFRDVLDLYAKAFATSKGAQDVVALVNRHATWLMGMPINAITGDEVERVIDPVNKVTPKTGSSARCDRVFIREGETMARGRRPGSVGGVEIPDPTPAPRRSLFVDAPRAGPFYRRLLAKGSTTSLCLAFLILNAMRGCEVLGLKWSDIDAAKRMIVIPATRMKARREHRIPISNCRRASSTGCCANGWANPGFRATFSSWAHSETDTPHELIELSLAHAEGRGNAVARSYNRTDSVERRRPLMSGWGSFCAGALEGSAGGAASVLEGLD